MRIIITGINGFIGSETAHRLVEKGHSIVGIGRQKQARSFVPKEVEYQCYDLQNPLPNFEADAVIHCVGSADDQASFDTLFLRNVVTTNQLIKASSNIPKFIFISTSSVYNFGEEKMSEEHTLANIYNNLSSYGKSKLLAEKSLLTSRENKCTIILRPRIVYGKGDRLILPRLLRLIRFNRLLVPAHLTENISLTNIQNLIKAIELSLFQNSDKSGIYNICDSDNYSLQTVLPKLVQAAYCKPLNVLKIPARLWNTLISLNSIFHFTKNISVFGSKQITSTGLMDASKAKEELGYEAEFSMDDAYPVISEWVKTQGGWKNYRDHLLH